MSSEQELQRRSQEIQQIAEEHLGALFEQLEQDGDEVDSSAAYAPFCGCITCMVREVLMVTSEKVEELVLLANAKPKDEKEWWKR